MKLSDEAILRRIDFLLNEAKCKMTKKDQTITYAMRVISNHCSIEEDAGSAKIKKRNKRMSQEAYKLWKNLASKKWTKAAIKKWTKATINEHQEPLKQTWEWIFKNHKKLSREKVLERFQLWRMVTVTHEEDRELRKRKCRDKGPVERYHLAGIRVGELKGQSWKPLSPEISD